jgi:hypothetical protein
MNSDFKNFIYARAEKALMENEEYKKIQSKCVESIKRKDFKEYEDLLSDSETKAQELCYMQGFKDALQITTNQELK